MAKTIRMCADKAVSTGQQCKKRARKGYRLCGWHLAARNTDEKAAAIYDAMQVQQSAHAFLKWLSEGVQNGFLTADSAMALLNERVR